MSNHTQLTPTQKKEVYGALRRRYNSIEEMVNHVELISKLTRGRSGMFGVPFAKLVPFVQALKQSKLN